MKLKLTIFLAMIFLAKAVFAEPVEIAAEKSIFQNVSIIKFENTLPVIEERLMDEGLEGEVRVKIYGFDKGITLKQKHDVFNVDVKKFDLNKRTRRFSTTLTFSSGEYSEELQLRGSYEELVYVPVLTSRTSHGIVISSADIEYQKMPKHRLRVDTILNEEEIAGKVLKRSMRAGREIRKRDIERKQLVARNNTVNMMFKNEFITLSAVGVALEDGAEGDTIRVRNVDSKKTVQAIITDSGVVSVVSDI